MVRPETRRLSILVCTSTTHASPILTPVLARDRTTAGTLGGGSIPSVVFSPEPSDTQKFEWESLKPDLPDPHKPPAHQLLSDGMRKRRASHKDGLFGKSSHPTPRLSHPNPWLVKGTHGLISPFDSLPLQGVSPGIHCVASVTHDL